MVNFNINLYVLKNILNLKINEYLYRCFVNKY